MEAIQRLNAIMVTMVISVKLMKTSTYTLGLLSRPLVRSRSRIGRLDVPRDQTSRLSVMTIPNPPPDHHLVDHLLIQAVLLLYKLYQPGVIRLKQHPFNNN